MSFPQWVELTDSMAQQVLEYNTNLVTTVVLTDPDGQDWANSKPYMDGESVSSSVQFWWYHMQVAICHRYSYKKSVAFPRKSLTNRKRQLPSPTSYLEKVYM